MATATQERIVIDKPGAKAERDILLMLFKDMVEDAIDSLRESRPLLAVMVREMECGR